MSRQRGGIAARTQKLASPGFIHSFRPPILTDHSFHNTRRITTVVSYMPTAISHHYHHLTHIHSGCSSQACTTSRLRLHRQRFLTSRSRRSQAKRHGERSRHRTRARRQDTSNTMHAQWPTRHAADATWLEETNGLMIISNKHDDKSRDLATQSEVAPASRSMNN